MLQAGARIAVVSPAGIFDTEGLARGMDLVRAWGYQAVPETDLFARHRYTAGTIQQRAAGLVWALTAPDIDAVWFARGGYGTAQLLTAIPWRHLDQRPVIGFSDATALFAAMQSRGRGRGVHGPVLHSLADLPDDASLAALRGLLDGTAPAWLPGRPLCGPHRAVQGPVVGGNLAIISSLCGTPWQLRASGRVLLLEDVGEAPYRIDRMLCQLDDSGVLDGVLGVGIGDLRGSAAPAGADWTLEDVLVERLGPLGVPVIVGLPFGHGPRNHAWTVGAAGVLDDEGMRQGV